MRKNLLRRKENFGGTAKSLSAPSARPYEKAGNQKDFMALLQVLGEEICRVPFLDGHCGKAT